MNHLRKLYVEMNSNKEDFRPISASIKHPNLYKLTSAYTKTKNDFPNLFANKKTLIDNNKKFPNSISEKVTF